MLASHGRKYIEISMEVVVYNIDCLSDAIALSSLVSLSSTYWPLSKDQGSEMSNFLQDDTTNIDVLVIQAL